jgi:transketolase
MREAYGKALVKLGSENTRVVALSAEVSNSDFSGEFEKAFPERFFNVGIAEQALVDVAVGLSQTGSIPFASTFAFLFATRAVEMIRTHLCYGGANVKLAAAYSGLSDSFDGPTHHSVTDLAIMRSLPGITILVPADAYSLSELVPLAAETDGPIYLRICRNEVEDLVEPNGQQKQKPFTVGGSRLMRQGDDVAILAAGVAVHRALLAAEELSRKGVEARVVDMYSVKPLDGDAVLAAARETRGIVTVEEHSIVGGLGGAVAEHVSRHAPVPVFRLGVEDTFAETGPYEDLLNRYGLAVESIVGAAGEVVELAGSASAR